APDYVVALDVVAGPGAPVTQDAGVMIDGDDRARQVGAAAGAARQARVAAHLVRAGEREELVVAGRRLLRVALPCGLIGDQQLRQHGAAALDLGRVRLHLHAVLAGPHAGGGERGRAHVHHAHPADPDRVETLVVTEH